MQPLYYYIPDRLLRAVPQLLGVLLCVFSTVACYGDVSPDPFIVVIDAGHGGNDAGALGVKTNEKSINLGVATRLARLISEHYYPEQVRVVMTRDADFFVTLNGRSQIANKAGAHLFISIHANSLDLKNPRRKTVRGASVYTLGLSRSDENFAVAKRENSVMMLEEDYTTTYQGFDPESDESYIIFEMDRDIHMEQSIRAAQAIQNELIGTAGRADRGVRQAPFAVLRNAAMPAVLVELDFISNPDEERYMSSEAGQEQLAMAIFRGMDLYKTRHDRDRGVLNEPYNPLPPKPATPAKSAPAPAVQTVDNENAADTPSSPTPDDDEIVYRIQFLTSPAELPAGSPRFKGLKDVSSYRHNGSVKYVTGRYASQRDAEKDLARVRKLFGDAFIVRMQGNRRADL